MLMMAGVRDEYVFLLLLLLVVALCFCPEESTTSTPTLLNINGFSVSAKQSGHRLQQTEYRSAPLSHF